MYGPALLIPLVMLSVPLVASHAYLGGDTHAPYGTHRTPDMSSGILSIPDHVLRETESYKRYVIFGDASGVDRHMRSANSDSGLFTVATLPDTSIPALRAGGHMIIPDMQLELHSADPAEISGITQVTSSQVAGKLGYTGAGVRIAIVDTGVDFSNPDMRHAVARDRDNIPIMLDADGQGIVLTNATFAANIDSDGILRNHEEEPDHTTSVVYRTHEGVFLDIDQGGDGTVLSVYNSLFPHSGPEPTFNGTLGNDMRIGHDGRDYIVSQSGIYRLGVIYQGALSGPYTGLQVVPVLVVDSHTPGVYDTIIPDLSTAWADYTKSDLPRGEEPDYDFDFTDEKPITLGSGNELFIYDHDGDGTHDFSAGMAGARVLDVYGVLGDESGIDETLQAINGTLLPPMDPGGEFFGVMTDFVGHGTSSAASIVSKGLQEYDIYGNADRYVIRGAAPDAQILPVKALWFGDTVYASLWTAGFDNTNGTWEFSGAPRADVISNSWGISNFPTLNHAPGLDVLSVLHTAIATPRSLDRNYPGVLIVSSAGNSGHGYGTIGMPGSAPLALTVGATTNNVFVGHGQFAGQPRFGNTTQHANHMVDFSSRGPSIIGDPKPELVSMGAHSFVPAQVTRSERNYTGAPFSMFGGTSMAAPLVSGAAAVVIQALHENGQDYDPFRVKNILVSSADGIQNDPLVQGAGMVNADSAVQFIRGTDGHFIVHNDASYRNIRDVLHAAVSGTNSTAFGVQRLVLPDQDHPQSTWFGGHVQPGGRSTATFTIENPSSEPLELEVTPQRMRLIERTEYGGTTVLGQQDMTHNKSGVYAPNYIRLSDVREFESVASYFGPRSMPEGASLLVLTASFGFDEFMNRTDPMFANDLKIASLYAYDWQDKNNDTDVSSDELSMVNRAGSWGTVQELRVSDPREQFEHTPLVGIYPVPARYSYWLGEQGLNATSMDYAVSASYYAKEPWGRIWLDSRTIEVPPRGTADVSATITVPPDHSTGVYQGSILFESDAHAVDMPVTFVVKEPIRDADSGVYVPGRQSEDVMFGQGYFKGAFDMVNRYMAGDWRQFYFDVQDPGINTGILDISWEEPDTNLSVFAIDPEGMIVQTNVPSGAFGHFMDWPTSDWLGTTPFSQGGGFYPVKNKDDTSSGLYIPINQTGTYTILAHSGLFAGNSTTEEISIAAKFTDVPVFGGPGAARDQGAQHAAPG